MAIEKWDTIIIGGGVMGLSCAFEEVKRGKSVCLLEGADQIGTRASSAAGGLMATRDSRKFFSTFREFSVHSVGIYPSWLSEVSLAAEEEISPVTGGDYIFYNMKGEKGRAAYKRTRDRLDREEAQNWEEGEIPPDFMASHLKLENFKILYFPEEKHIDNRRLLRVLARAIENRGGEILTSNRVEKILPKDEGVEVATKSTTHFAPHVVIAAGVWSRDLLRTAGWDIPLIPVKGQMMKIPAFHSSKAVIHFQRDVYLVPRSDGLLVGSTTEPRRWDASFNEGGESELYGYLQEFLALPRLRPLDSWAGLRPRTRDRRPFLGFVDENRSLLLCTGHYKNGITMAPLSGICIAKMIAGEKLPLVIDAFDPRRKKGVTPWDPVT